MADSDHLTLLASGAEQWNRLRPKWPEFQNTDFDGADLSGCDLDAANFTGCSLVGAKLRACNLRGAFMSRTDLSRADMSDTNAYYARFVEARMGEAKLVGTKLTGACLDGANLDGADLTQADLSGAQLRGSSMVSARLRSAMLMGASFMFADLSGADLGGSVMIGATLVKTNVEACIFDDCHVYGVSAWDLTGEPASSNGLLISPQGNVSVSDLKMAQFMYLMLENRHLRDVIDSITSKTVLLLGRFTPSRKRVLDELRDLIRCRDLVPVIFDFEKPSDRDVTETVGLLARMSRYVIADLTDSSSVPQELQAFVPNVAVPVQPIVLAPQTGWSMFSDLKRKYHWVLEPMQYTDAEDLSLLLDKLLEPAERKRQDLQRENVPPR